MNRIALSVIATVLLAGGQVIAQPSTGQVLQNPLPLARTVIVTDIDAPPETDDPGTGGGFDISSYFQNKLTSPANLSACIADVETAVSQWAMGLGLSRTLKQSQPASLMLHYVKDDLPGLFAIAYDVTEGIRARIAVDFYSLDGAERAPELAIELNTTFRVAELQDALDIAMSC